MSFVRTAGILSRMATIFASATTRDLKSYRQVVAEWARSRGYAVVVQDEFPVTSDYGTIVQMLREKLDPCDAVIHLAALNNDASATYEAFLAVNRDLTLKIARAATV